MPSRRNRRSHLADHITDRRRPTSSWAAVWTRSRISRAGLFFQSSRAGRWEYISLISQTWPISASRFSSSFTENNHYICNSRQQGPNRNTGPSNFSSTIDPYRRLFSEEVPALAGFSFALNPVWFEADSNMRLPSLSTSSTITPASKSIITTDVPACPLSRNEISQHWYYQKLTRKDFPWTTTSIVPIQFRHFQFQV